ncbi:predicted protein [Botrytis cinerea T4]|uniref:Uncharacterized protein n=1 Tax=Botryotinia fuckeliana (strain T4) TaxID=999810 RepID=G2Y8D1_BOTF4|nr:predicted protein [Botrytis cinerea T4]
MTRKTIVNTCRLPDRVPEGEPSDLCPDSFCYEFRVAWQLTITSATIRRKVKIE